jgi:hypothetical protein
MKKSKMMKERIRRVQVLFRELGFSLTGGMEEDDLYSGGFESADGFEGGYLIDKECRFLELVFSFSFTPELNGFVRGRLEEMLSICFDFGCYISFDKADQEIAFSVYSKIYYIGLNYYSLRETLYDFMDCVDELKELLAIDGGTGAKDEAKEGRE